MKDWTVIEHSVVNLRPHASPDRAEKTHKNREAKQAAAYPLKARIQWCIFEANGVTHMDRKKRRELGR